MEAIGILGKQFSQIVRLHHILIFIAGIFFGGIATSANALDWNDKNWNDIGCPINISGNWVSRDRQNSIEFEDHRIVEKTKGSRVTIFLHNDSLQALGNRFINIALKPKKTEEGQQLFFKIRPHLAFEKKNSNPPLCFIKIFTFDSEKDLKFNKYKSWKIYKKM